MSDPTRLQTAAPALAEAFRAASPEARRRAAREACEHAVANGRLSTPETEASLAALRARSAPDPSLGRRLEELAARLDDAYLELQEDRSKLDAREALARFTQARAAAALACAVSSPPDQLHEAIYEATATLDDPSQLVSRLLSILADGG